MAILRYLLLIATAILFIYVVYETWDAWVRDIRTDPAWMTYLVLTYLILTGIYLVASTPGKSDWRLLRLLNLWLDAKERELRDRAGK